MADHPTRAVIDLAALSHNLKIIRQRIGPHTQLLVVIKANAYGHGARDLALHLQKEGVDMLGVAFIEEGVALRQAGITLPILVMTGSLRDQMEMALEWDLMLSISDLDTVEVLSHLASKSNRSAKIHVKIDTGMGRLGFPFEDAMNAIRSIYSLPHIELKGISTHLSTADDPDPTYTSYQTERFRSLRDSLSGYGIPLPMFHMGNSGAVLQHPETYFDMVRVGIMVYGIAPSLKLQDVLPIRPIMSLKTKIIHIKRVAKGSSLSYGRTYVCPSEKLIAIIPMGYSDGLLRCMAGKIHVLIKGVRIPVVGTVCMDMCLLDVTGIEGVKIADEVVLIGSQGEEMITAHDWAAWQDTIPYEVLCAIGHRVKRIYQD